MTKSREQEKDMIGDSSKWPFLDHLCLKKRASNPARGYEDFGIIVNSVLPIVIYLRPDLKEVVQYDTIDELLDDHWIVD